MKNRVLVKFFNMNKQISEQIEIPLEISAQDLINALNEIYSLGLDVNNEEECYLAAENPTCFLSGDIMLRDYGIRNGTIIIFKR